MKAVRFSRFGRASEVAELVEIPPPAAGVPPGQVLFQLEAAPVNPSDLLHFSGSYADKAPLPSFAGGGVLGRIVQCGPGVANVKRGDRVIVVNTERSGWRERFTWPAAGLLPLPEGDPVALALLAANPPTALLLLENFCDLQPGDWVMQNAANSSVGTSVIQIAAARGVRTVNIVRRPEPVAELKALGADVVLLDGPTLQERVAEAIGGQPVRLGLDAVAGEATRRMAACTCPGGGVVNYGLLSGKPCEIDPADVLFRDVSLKGFWYAGWYSRASEAEVLSLFERLLALHQSDRLRVPLEAVYPVEQLNTALAHAERQGRSGKVVLRW